MKKYIVLLLSLGLIACSGGEDEKAPITPTGDSGGDVGDSGGGETTPSIPTSCGVDLYLDGGSCVAVSVGEYSADGDTSKASCTNTDTNVATLTYTSVGGGSNNCTFTVDSCDSGHHIESNLCVSDVRSCSVANGTGEETWNGSSWDSCTVTSCNEGYADNTSSCDLTHEIVDLSGIQIDGDRKLVSSANGIVFVGSIGGDRELYKYNTSNNQIELLKNINPSGNSALKVFDGDGSNVFFKAYDGTDTSLWVTDGTESGTVKIPSSTYSYDFIYDTDYLMAGDGRFYFICRNGMILKPCSTDGVSVVESNILLGYDFMHSRGINTDERRNLLKRFYEKNGTVYVGENDGISIVIHSSTNGLFDTEEESLNYDEYLFVDTFYDFRITLDETNDFNFIMKYEEFGTKRVAVGQSGTSPFSQSIENYSSILAVEHLGEIIFTESSGTSGTFVAIDGGIVSSYYGALDLIYDSIEFNNNLYISMDSNSHDSVELVEIDSGLNASLVKEINTSGASVMTSDTRLTKTNNYIYYVCDSGAPELEICRTDGTESGTSVYYALDSSSEVDNIASLFHSDGYIYGVTLDNSSGPQHSKLFRLKVE